MIAIQKATRRGTESKNKVPNTVVDITVKTRSRTKEEVIPVYKGRNVIGVQIGKPKHPSQQVGVRAVGSNVRSTGVPKKEAIQEAKQKATAKPKAKPKAKPRAKQKARKVVKKAKQTNEEENIIDAMAQIKAKKHKTEEDLEKYVKLQNELTKKAKKQPPPTKQPTKKEIAAMTPEQKLKYLGSLSQLTPEQEAEFIELDREISKNKKPTGRSMFK